jgi:putative transposase
LGEAWQKGVADRRRLAPSQALDGRVRLLPARPTSPALLRVRARCLFTEDGFGPLLLKLRAHLEARRIILVWDRLSAHATSRKTRAFIAENASWLQVELLPTAAPELNPVEQVWAWIKRGPPANLAPPDLDHLADAAGRALNQFGHRFPLLTAFLRHTELA